MGHKFFSTKNADYVFAGINHFRSHITPGSFKGIDALVTEFSAEAENHRFAPQPFGDNRKLRERIELLGDKAPFLARIAYSWACRSAKKSLAEVNSQIFTVSRWPSQQTIDEMSSLKVPVYSIRARISEEERILENGRVETLQSPSLFYSTVAYSLMNREISDQMIERCITNSFQKMAAVGIGTSAIVAEKIEHGLAPLIRNRKKSKPRIGIVYGIAHVDMIPLLQDDQQRYTVIKEFEGDKFQSFIQPDIDQITLFDPIAASKDAPYGGWYLKNQHLGLFKKGNFVCRLHPSP